MHHIDIIAEEPRRDDRYEDDKIAEKLMVETFKSNMCRLKVNTTTRTRYIYTNDSTKHYILSVV